MTTRVVREFAQASLIFLVVSLIGVNALHLYRSEPFGWPRMWFDAPVVVAMVIGAFVGIFARGAKA